MIEFAFLLLLLIGLTQISIHRNRFISPFLAVSLTIYIMCWNIFPFLYSIFMSERTDNIISNPTYQKVVVIQLISVFTILMLFNILNILHKFQSKPKRLPYRQRKDANANLILVLLVISLIFLLFAKINSVQTVGYTFLERVLYTVSVRNMEDAVRAILSALTGYIIPFAIACIFSRIDTLRYNRWIMCLSITIIAMHIGFMLVFGQRVAIFLPVVLIFLYFNVHKLKLGLMTKSSIVALIFILILVAPILSMYVKSIRGMKSYDIEDLLAVSSSEYFTNVGEYNLMALDDLYSKFCSFENGTTLLEIEGTSRVGLSLITSALTSPIPRMLYSAKPVPFSCNGEYSGVPYYLVPSLRGLLPGNVVPIPPSTIALWELGYVGLLLMIVFNVVSLLFINFFLKSKLLLYNTMGFFMLFIPTFEFLLAPTGWIIKEGLRILALIFFIKLLLLIGKFKRNVLGLQNLTTNYK